MGSRIRTVKPEWLDDEKLSTASDSARVLSVALILLADDYGNGRLGPELTISTRCYPNSRDPRETFAKAFGELARISYCFAYCENGQHYFNICNWARHQRVDKPGKPHVPALTSRENIYDFEHSRHSRDTLAKSQEIPGNPSADLDLDRYQEGTYGAPHDEKFELGPVTVGTDMVSGPDTEADKPKRKSAKKAPLPTKPEIELSADWRPSADHLLFAKSHGLNVEFETIKFRSHYAGKKTVCWNGRFHAWLVKAVEYAKRDGTYKEPSGSQQELTGAVW